MITLCSVRCHTTFSRSRACWADDEPPSSSVTLTQVSARLGLPLFASLVGDAVAPAQALHKVIQFGGDDRYLSHGRRYHLHCLSFIPRDPEIASVVTNNMGIFLFIFAILLTIYVTYSQVCKENLKERPMIGPSHTEHMLLIQVLELSRVAFLSYVVDMAIDMSRPCSQSQTMYRFQGMLYAYVQRTATRHGAPAATHVLDPGNVCISRVRHHAFCHHCHRPPVPWAWAD